MIDMKANAILQPITDDDFVILDSLPKIFGLDEEVKKDFPAYLVASEKYASSVQKIITGSKDKVDGELTGIVLVALSFFTQEFFIVMFVYVAVNVTAFKTRKEKRKINASVINRLMIILN